MHLINLKGIEELKKIQHDETEGLQIGGLVPLGVLERSEIVKERFPLLCDALHVLAAPQIRNLGTIGGNLCSALPSADTAPPLIALGAKATIAGNTGEIGMS